MQSLTHRSSWTDFGDLVATRFNDPDFRPHCDLSHVLLDLDRGRPPQIYRSSSFLKKKVNNRSADFTFFYGQWGLSGENDPENVKTMVASDMVRRGMPNGDLKVQGKRCLLLFHICRCGR